jgi:hypothetical protein
MPEPVAEIEYAATVVAIQRLPALVEIRYVDHAVLQPQLVILCDIAAGRTLDLSEIPGERHLLIVVDGLVAKREHGIAIHTGVDRGGVLVRQRRAQVYAGHLAREPRAHWMNGYRHVRKFDRMVGRIDALADVPAVPDILPHGVRLHRSALAHAAGSREESTTMARQRTEMTVLPCPDPVTAPVVESPAISGV